MKQMSDKAGKPTLSASTINKPQAPKGPQGAQKPASSSKPATGSGTFGNRPSSSTTKK